MSEVYYRCVPCGADILFGAFHCRLCHKNYSRGTEHRCEVLDAVVQEEREPSTIDPRFRNPRLVFAAESAPIGARDWSEVKPAEVPCGE